MRANPNQTLDRPSDVKLPALADGAMVTVGSLTEQYGKTVKAVVASNGDTPWPIIRLSAAVGPYFVTEKSYVWKRADLHPV